MCVSYIHEANTSALGNFLLMPDVDMGASSIAPLRTRS